MYKLKTQSPQTDLNAAIHFTMTMLKRKSIVIILSDFIDQDYGQALRTLSRKHDVVVIHLIDRREEAFPRLGIIPLYDPELRRSVWMNTSLPGFSRFVKNQFQRNQIQLEELCRQQKTNYLAIRSTDDYVSALVRLFRVRNGR